VQLGRLDYQPQTAPALANANSIDFGDLEVSQSQIEGEADIIQRCFPNTYGEPLVEITAAKGKTIHLAKKIGVAFCGRYVDTEVYAAIQPHTRLISFRFLKPSIRRAQCIVGSA
jgi:hypothetical protein